MKSEEEAMMLVVENNVESSGAEGEFGGSSSLQIAKRKRTKRRRSSGVVVCGRNSSSSATTTTTEEEEEEDMANCLILLAESGGRRSFEDEVVLKTAETRKPKKNKETISSSLIHSSGVNNSNAVYECKTCDKAFNSFQALGGHRASHHKKPKLLYAADTKTTTNVDSPTTTLKTSVMVINRQMSPPASNSYATHSAKVHECAICGSAFSSGQALGGHMRRHRTTAGINNDDNQMAVATTVAVEVDVELQPEKVGILLVDRYIRADNNNNNFLASLDLNLPAPAEEGVQDDEDEMSRNLSHRRMFIHQQLAATGQNSSSPSTTAPPLVGCYF